MILYIVLSSIDYEGSEVRGAFEDKDRARQFAETQRAHWYCDSVHIESWDGETYIEREKIK